MRVYFGARGQAIYVAELDEETGVLTGVQTAGEATRPGFVALHPDGSTLYAVERGGEGADDDVVGSFRIDAATGMLTRLTTQASRGANPTHLVVTPDGKHLLVAKYDGGSVTSFPIAEDGSLEPAQSHVQHEGSSVHPERQTKPFAHGVAVNPDGSTVFVADLGIDKVLVYDFSSSKLGEVHEVPTSVGGGPRHLVVHPNGRWVYANNELTNTVEVIQGSESGWQLVETVSTLPEGYAEESFTAEIFLHPNGRFLYVSNRGHDSAAVFAIDPDSGCLTLIEAVPVHVKAPRGMGIDASGKWLIACGQDSSDATVFAVDSETGLLTQSGGPVDVPDSPVCVVFC